MPGGSLGQVHMDTYNLSTDHRWNSHVPLAVFELVISCSESSDQLRRLQLEQEAWV